MKFPAIFLSHGAPTLAVDEGVETRAWAELASKLPRPRSILVASAHWDTPDPEVSGAARMEAIYDFSGFPRALYEQKYPAPGAPELAQRTAALLQKSGISCAVDPARGLDHGAWVPLKWMYPGADIPVTQLSVKSHRGPAHHLLLAYRERAPNARRSHPTEDHFAPFFVALGAGGWPARRLDLGFDLGTLGLDGYVFGG
jgi:4,5-DOPA dioxygenase extradiol